MTTYASSAYKKDHPPAAASPAFKEIANSCEAVFIADTLTAVDFQALITQTLTEFRVVRIKH
jgi:hypothetical protein